MMRRVAVREVGSDFASMAPDMLLAESDPPWKKSGCETVYTETGRQALTIVSRVLARRGVDEVLVPSHLCESMVEPFRRAGWRIGVLELSSDLRLDRRVDWNHIRHRGRRMAVLLASYFGQEPDRSHLQIAQDAKDCGATVIEDETHRVFAPGGVDADITFASLRKLLPVADGAYVQGDPEILAEVAALRAGDGQRWVAMDMKRRSLAEGSTPVHREAMRTANLVLEDSGRLCGPSVRTMDTIRRLPYERFAATRTRNASILRDALASTSAKAALSICAPVPSHLVVRVERPIALQRHLATLRVYCPIHWPPVSGLPTAAWRSDLLSLPIDHRYGPTDMMWVAEAVRRGLGQ